MSGQGREDVETVYHQSGREGLWCVVGRDRDPVTVRKSSNLGLRSPGEVKLFGLSSGEGQGRVGVGGPGSGCPYCLPSVPGGGGVDRVGVPLLSVVCARRGRCRQEGSLVHGGESRSLGFDSVLTTHRESWSQRTPLVTYTRMKEKGPGGEGGLEPDPVPRVRLLGGFWSRVPGGALTYWCLV